MSFDLDNDVTKSAVSGAVGYALGGDIGMALGAVYSLYNSKSERKALQKQKKREDELRAKEVERGALIEKIFLEEKEKERLASEDAQFGLLAERASQRRNKTFADSALNDFGVYGEGIVSNFLIPSGKRPLELKDILE